MASNHKISCTVDIMIILWRFNTVITDFSELGVLCHDDVISFAVTLRMVWW